MSTRKRAPTESAIWRNRAKSMIRGIGAAAGDDHLRLVFVGQPRQFVVVDAFVFPAHAVRHDVVGLAGEVELVPVREVAAVRQVHPQDGVAGCSTAA